MKKKLTIISRHYPPNKNINGILACEMVSKLEKKGVSCHVLCMDVKAEGNNAEVVPSGKVTTIKPFFKGKNKISKLLALFFDGYTLIKEAKKIDSSLTIVSTSPPLLPFWASLLFSKKNKWALWSLDLFPEGFLLNNQMSNKNPFYHFLKKQTYKNSPSYLLALGKEQAIHIKNEYKRNIPTIILPAGVLLKRNKLEKKMTPLWYHNDKIILGYFGNLSQAHSYHFIESVIKNSNQNKFKIVLSVYGIHSKKINEFAKGFEHVTIIENGIPQEHLSFINVHLISLKYDWTHIAVPSKAVTAVSCGRPILFCGNEKSDNWQMFKEVGWFIDDSKNIDTQCIDFLKKIRAESIVLKAKKTESIYLKLQQQVLDAYLQISKITS